MACIDASVAAKWVLVESDSELAHALLADLRAAGVRMVVPLHLPAEVTSAVYKRMRDGLLTAQEAHQALLEFGLVELTPGHPIGVTQQALSIAALLGSKYPYDAFYLALGEALDCDVWTADGALYAAAHDSFPRLRLLSDFDAAV